MSSPNSYAITWSKRSVASNGKHTAAASNANHGAAASNCNPGSLSPCSRRGSQLSELCDVSQLQLLNSRPPRRRAQHGHDPSRCQFKDSAGRLCLSQEHGGSLDSRTSAWPPRAEVQLLAMSSSDFLCVATRSRLATASLDPNMQCNDCSQQQSTVRWSGAGDSAGPRKNSTASPPPRTRLQRRPPRPLWTACQPRQGSGSCARSSQAPLWTEGG